MGMKELKILFKWLMGNFSMPKGKILGLKEQSAKQP